MHMRLTHPSAKNCVSKPAPVRCHGAVGRHRDYPFGLFGMTCVGCSSNDSRL